MSRLKHYIWIGFVILGFLSTSLYGLGGLLLVSAACALATYDTMTAAKKLS